MMMNTTKPTKTVVTFWMLHLPCVRNRAIIAVFAEESGHVVAGGVVLLSELEAGGLRKPGDELGSSAHLDGVVADAKLRGVYVTNDFHT